MAKWFQNNSRGIGNAESARAVARFLPKPRKKRSKTVIEVFASTRAQHYTKRALFGDRLDAPKSTFLPARWKAVRSDYEKLPMEVQAEFQVAASQANASPHSVQDPVLHVYVFMLALSPFSKELHRPKKRDIDVALHGVMKELHSRFPRWSFHLLAGGPGLPVGEEQEQILYTR